MTTHYAEHSRNFGEFEYVYPVVSRRSGGISLGINLSRHSRACSFRCIYCQVRAEVDDATNFCARGENVKINFAHEVNFDVDLAQLEKELRILVAMAQENSLFTSLPLESRRLRDIAFSGDGEPTLSPQFESACEIAARVQRECNLNETQLVLITNATHLSEISVRRGIDKLLSLRGEIWGKLDAGNAASFARINLLQPKNENTQNAIAVFARVIASLKNFATQYQIVIQTCLFEHHGIIMSDEECAEYVTILKQLRNLNRVQLYTVARVTPDPNVRPISDAQLAEFAKKIGENLSVKIEAFGAAIA